MSDPKTSNLLVRYFRGIGAGSLLISIVVHVLLLGGAATYVISTVREERELAFQSGPAGQGGAPERQAVEHRVQMSRQQSTLSAVTQRLSVDSPNAAVALPDLPDMPGFSGSGPSLGGSLGGPGGPGAPGGAGGASGPVMRGPLISAFGFRDAQPGGTLVGNFYDFKQLRSGSGAPRPNPDYKGNINAAFDPAASSLAHKEILEFVNGNWSRSRLNKFFVAPEPLYATQIYIPTISATEAPKAFGVEKLAKDKGWMALYRGRVSPPSDGTYRFTGAGDDILIVRMDGRLVLDGSVSLRTKFKPDRDEGHKYSFRGNLAGPKGFRIGDAMQLRAGQFYDIQIVVSEAPGGQFNSFLLYEKQGETYAKTSTGAPILPLFRVADTKLEPSPNGPPFMPDGPVWRAVPPAN